MILCDSKRPRCGFKEVSLTFVRLGTWLALIWWLSAASWLHFIAFHQLLGLSKSELLTRLVLFTEQLITCGQSFYSSISQVSPHLQQKSNRTSPQLTVPSQPEAAGFRSPTKSTTSREAVKQLRSLFHLRHFLLLHLHRYPALGRIGCVTGTARLVSAAACTGTEPGPPAN